MNEKTMIRDLTTGSVTRQLLAFSMPFVLSNLLQTMYSMVDMIVVGQFVGSAGLSAVSIGGDLQHFITFVGMGFASAGQVIISQYVGANNREAISRTIGTMSTIILSASIVFSVVCIVCVDPLMRFMNTSAEAYSEARNYTVVCCTGLFFIYGYNVVSSILRGMGDSKRPFFFIGIAAVANLVLDLLFVAVFKMAAAGAALATVMGQGISFIASLVYLYRRREAFGFDFKLRSFIPDRVRAKQLCALGFPMLIQSAAIHFSMLLVNSYINAFGVAASAASGVGNKLSTIATVVTGALNTANSAMVGQNMGAGKPERVNRVVGISLAIGVGFTAVLSLLLILFPTKIFGIFNTDPDVLAYAVMYVPCGVLAFIGFALRAPLMGMVNGIGFASLGLVVGILDGVIIRIGLSLLMGIVLDMGVVGFWYGNALAGFVPFFIDGAYFLSGKWKTRKLITQ